jgi:hypothetical protein
VGDETILDAGALQPGQRVVTDGHLRVKPGAKVQIKPSSSTQQATTQSS